MKTLHSFRRQVPTIKLKILKKTQYLGELRLSPRRYEDQIRLIKKTGTKILHNTRAVFGRPFLSSVFMALFTESTFKHRFF